MLGRANVGGFQRDHRQPDSGRKPNLDDALCGGSQFVILILWTTSLCHLLRCPILSGEDSFEVNEEALDLQVREPVFEQSRGALQFLAVVLGFNFTVTVERG